jgi:hypothetical protein
MSTKIQSIEKVALLLKVPYEWLYNLIKFESGLNPLATNKISGARGLIQFMHATARDMKFTDANDLVKKFPDIDSQVAGPVYNYLKKYMPFPNQQSLYMSVFYPAARNWELGTFFPQKVRNANPNIDTVGSYVNKVNGVKRKAVAISPIVVLIIGFVFFKFFK